MIRKMIEVVQQYKNPSAEDLFYSAKLIKSIESGFSRYVLPVYRELDEYEEGYILENRRIGWSNTSLDLIALSQQKYNYACLEFRDGRHLPLPIFVEANSEHPMQNEIIKMYRETEEGRRLLEEIEQHCFEPGRRFFEKIKREHPEGEHTIFIRPQNWPLVIKYDFILHQKYMFYSVERTYLDVRPDDVEEVRFEEVDHMFLNILKDVEYQISKNVADLFGKPEPATA